MFSLAIFGICLAITIVVLILVAAFIGSWFILLFVTPPLLLAACITGERANFFAPNGGGKPKLLTNLLTLLFCILIVLLLACGVYSIYTPIHRAASFLMTVGQTIRLSLNPLTTNHLLSINSVLWLGSCSFLGIVLINLFRFWKQAKRMSKDKIFAAFVRPLFMHILSLPFLFSARQYLAHYPASNSSLSIGMIAVGLFYGKFLFESQTHQSNAYKSVIQTDKVSFGQKSVLLRSLVLLHAFIFAYFLARIILSSSGKQVFFLQNLQ
jgi:hypothetical protein